MRKYNAYFKIEYNKSAETENIKPINDELLDVFKMQKLILIINIEILD